MDDEAEPSLHAALPTSARETELTPRVGRKASLVLASQLVGGLLGYGALLVVGRYFDPASYGAYIFALGALGLVVAILGNFGFGEAHVHFVARGVDVSQALGVYVRIRLGLAALLAGLAVGGGFLWFSVLGKRITDATTVPILVVMLGMQLLSSVRQIGLDTWLGREKVNRGELAKTLDTVLSLAFVAVVGLALAGATGRWTPTGSLAPWLAEILGMELGPWNVQQAGLALCGCYFVAKALSLAPVAVWWLKDRLHVGPWDGQLARRYAGYAFPVALAGAVGLVLSYTDIVMLGYFRTAADVGVYGMAQRLASFTLIAAMAAGTPLLPRFSALLQAGRLAEARATLHKAERYLLLIAVPVGVALASLPVAILHIAVGDGFLGAADPLRFLGLWTIFLALATPARAKVLGAGHARVTLVTSLIAAVANGILNLWLIPDAGLGLGATGAAIGTLTSTLLSIVYLRWQLRKKFAIPLWDPVLVRMALAGAGAGGFWLTSWHRVGPEGFDRFWELGLWGLAGLAVFAALAALLGMLRRDDLQALVRLGAPRNLWRELRGDP